MSYKDKMQPASFRGIKFSVNYHSTNIGRRVISHEFPYGEKPFTEDLGKKQRSFNIDGFITGVDYFAQRDAIIAACEQSGSGELIHPYLGRMQVNCVSLTVTESKEEGYYASLSFQFVESGDTLRVLPDTDKISKLTQATQDLKNSTLNNFEQIYSVVNTAKSGIQKAKDAVNQVMDNLNKMQKLCADVAQTGNDLSQLVKEVSNGIDKIITFPNKVTALFETAYGALSTSIDKFNSKNDPKRLIAAASLLSSTSGSLASPNASTVTYASEEKNTPDSDEKRRKAWFTLSQNKIDQVKLLNSSSIEAQNEQRNKSIIELTGNTLALSYLADAAGSSTYLSSDDIDSTRNNILTLSDTLLEHPLISDEMFIAIQNTQTCLNNALLSIENVMPIITTIQVKKDTNLLSFLYDNFGNIDKEADLIKRNSITDPFEIKADTQLQVSA